MKTESSKWKKEDYDAYQGTS